MNFIAAHGARLADNGFSILPIIPGEKRPGRYSGGRWIGISGWQRYCDSPASEPEVAGWSAWPEGGIGIACGRVIGIDIDVLDSEMACRITNLAYARLGYTPAIRVGLAPKRLLVYRTETPFAGFKQHPLEVLGRGQQFVAYALHPATGRPYEWLDDSLADIDISELPEITEQQVRAFVAEAWQLLPENLRQSRLGGTTRANGNGAAVGGHGDLRGTIDAIEAALKWIPNQDLNYDDWVRIGMAIKGAIGDAGEALFADWSATSRKDVPDYTARTWAGFRPRSIGAGTIYQLAIDNGWSPAPGLILNGAMADLPPCDIVAKNRDARVGNAQASSPPPESGSDIAEKPRDACPLGLGELDGALGELVRYIIGTARRPQPALAVGAALAALGALMGRKYRTESNLRSNLYVVGIADSGSGKNHSREVINELFVHAGLGRYLGGNKIASGAGLLSALGRQPALICQIDEFGMFMAAAADRKRSPHHIVEIVDNMTELYTAAGSIFLGAEYSDQKLRPRKDIREPCLCVYGTTTPVHFWGALGSANIVDGSLARFLVMQSEDDYPEENDAAGIRQSQPDLLEAMKLIAAGGGRKSGNLAGAGSGPEFGTDPLTVPLSAEARKLFDELRVEMTTRLRASRGTAFSSILARVVEQAWKVAMIRAVSVAPVAPVIRAIDAEWSIALVRHCVDETMAAVERHVADNIVEANHKRVLNIIVDAGAGGITKNAISRRTQWLDRRSREDVLSSLVESGQVAVTPRLTATRPVAVYIAV